MKLKLFVPCLCLATTSVAYSKHTPMEKISELAGCFVVDYSYSENQVVDPQYQLDPRVYDVENFTVKELIKVVDHDEDQVRIQHFMQADDFAGNTIFMMRHHGEIWRKNPQYRYKYLGQFDGQNRWDVEYLSVDQDLWSRQITNLDDGLRYQCIGKWRDNTSFPRFDCSAFAPIPGRETRDMGRRDYNTMERKSSVLIYQDSWLERQKNTKVQFSAEGVNPLVNEVGKIWSVRVPMSECDNISIWADERQDFWDVLASAWNDAFDGVRPFYEIKTVDSTTRGAKISKLMQQHYKTIGSNQEEKDLVKAKIEKIIEDHRE